VFVCICLFGLFMLLCVSPGPTQYIFHTPMARYSLYVLKVPLNIKQVECNTIHSNLTYTQKLTKTVILVCYIKPNRKQETQVSLTNCTTHLKVSQVTKHGTIPYVRYGFILVCYRTCSLFTICGDACPLSCVCAEACFTSWPNAQDCRDGEVN